MLEKVAFTEPFIKTSLKETGIYNMLMLFTLSKSKKISPKWRTLQLLLLGDVTADFEIKGAQDNLTQGINLIES